MNVPREDELLEMVRTMETCVLLGEKDTATEIAARAVEENDWDRRVLLQLVGIIHDLIEEPPTAAIVGHILASLYDHMRDEAFKSSYLRMSDKIKAGILKMQSKDTMISTRAVQMLWAVMCQPWSTWHGSAASYAIQYLHDIVLPGLPETNTRMDRNRSKLQAYAFMRDMVVWNRGQALLRDLWFDGVSHDLFAFRQKVAILVEWDADKEAWHREFGFYSGEPWKGDPVV
jgi:hypothetical protein